MTLHVERIRKTFVKKKFYVDENKEKRNMGPNKNRIEYMSLPFLEHGPQSLGKRKNKNNFVSQEVMLSGTH